MIPGSVPAMLDSPISTPACCGAISRWLTLKSSICVAISNAVCYILLVASVVLVAVFVCTIDRHHFVIFDGNLSNADTRTKSQPRRSRRVPLRLTGRPQRRQELEGTSLAAWRPSGWGRPRKWTASWPALQRISETTAVTFRTVTVTYLRAVRWQNSKELCRIWRLVRGILHIMRIAI